MLQKIQALLKGKAHFLIDARQYGKRIEAVQQHHKMNMSNDTYICEILVPDNEITQVQSLLNVVIKHPSYAGVDFIRNLKVPRLKHASVNSKDIRLKKVRKVVSVRYFQKPQSAFCKFVPDTAESLARCFEHDMRYAKIDKMIKDRDELRRTEQVLLQHYLQLKDFFINTIALPKSYPQLERYTFQKICKTWRIKDDLLSTIAINRLWIATIYNENAEYNLDDSQKLNRYKFIEIIVRLAHTKYVDAGVYTSVSEALTVLLNKFILPHSEGKMAVQGFRDQHLWKLDVDDMLNANYQNIQAVFRQFCTRGTLVAKSFSLENALDLVHLLNQTFPKSFKYIADVNQKVTLAYSLSKMTIENEAQEFHKYHSMELVEFMEFLGRLSQLLFDDLSFLLKFQKLLVMLFEMTDLEFKLKKQVQRANNLSDYEDDMVDEFVHEVRPRLG